MRSASTRKNGGFSHKGKPTVLPSLLLFAAIALFITLCVSVSCSSSCTGCAATLAYAAKTTNVREVRSKKELRNGGASKNKKGGFETNAKEDSSTRAVIPVDALGLNVLKAYDVLRAEQRRAATESRNDEGSEVVVANTNDNEGRLFVLSAEAAARLAAANEQYAAAVAAALAAGRKPVASSMASGIVAPYNPSGHAVGAAAEMDSSAVANLLDAGNGRLVFDHPQPPTFAMGFPTVTVRELKAMSTKDLRRFIAERKGRCDACNERQQLLERAFALRSVPTKNEEVVSALTPYSTVAPQRLTTDLLRPQTPEEIAAGHQHAAQMAVFKDPRFVCEIAMKEEEEEKRDEGASETKASAPSSPSSTAAAGATGAQKKLVPHISCRPKDAK